jgi:hypothetical protein
VQLKSPTLKSAGGTEKVKKEKKKEFATKKPSKGAI